MPRKNLGPVSLDIDGVDGILESIREFIKTRVPSQVVTLNSLMFNIALRDREYSRTISNASLVIADSHGIAWASDLLGNSPRAERLTGIDLAGLLCGLAAAQGWGIYLLGAKPGVAETAAKELIKLYPGLIIKGTHHGYFTAAEDEAVVKLVASKAPDILMVGLEMPKQELWIAKHLKELNAPVVIGVGGSLDVFSGRLKRAPAWMRGLRLEWFFRFLQQPWRLKRLLDLPLFVISILRLKLRALG